MKESEKDRGVSRRTFLGQAVALLASPLVLSALPGRAFAASGKDASASTVDVRERGAVGDGTHDDTDAFQSAFDRLPASGGTVNVPAGSYLIDAARSIRPRSHTRLVLATGARLTAMPNALERSSVILVQDVDDVSISGGSIVGERDNHQGGSGEWGHGISILGARQVTISDIRVSACWGDGIYIGTIYAKSAPPNLSTDITLTRVVCTGNRRQGLSITASRNITVTDSEFSHTNGTKPACGIDIEPDTMKAAAQDIRISGCQVSDNQGSGLEMSYNVTRVQITNCQIERNNGYGILVSGTTQATIGNNTISDNGLIGAYLRKNAQDCQVTGNTFSDNSARALHSTLKSLVQSKRSTGGTRELKVGDDTQAITSSGNQFQ